MMTWAKIRLYFYNSRTGALAVVHEDQYKQYKGFQEKGKEIEDAEFLKNLFEMRISASSRSGREVPNQNQYDAGAV